MLLRRIADSTVVWSWLLNGLRMGSGLIVLPLVFRLFTKEDLGMYYVLLRLAGFAMILDFGFGPTIDRFVGYAMGGARTLEAHGAPTLGDQCGPNYQLLWELLFTTQKLYRYLTLALLVVLGIGGTYMVGRLVGQTSSPVMTWLAWIATLSSTLLDIYSNWWGIYLRGLNEVKAATKVAAAAVVVKLAISVALLLSGAGLLSLPIAGIVSSFIQRHFARLRCLKLLPARMQPTDFSTRKILRVLWPNSWRLGVQLMSSSLTTLGYSMICAGKYKLQASAQFEPSVQLMGIASSMACVWTFNKWPQVSQYRAQKDHIMIQRVLRPRIWLQMFTFIFLASGVVLIAPSFLHWIGKDKQLLPLPWMLCLMFSAFLELQTSTSGTLIATENRLPFLWPCAIANALSLTLSLILIHFTSIGIGALILGPLLISCAFNSWYWPSYAARTIGTTLFRFLFVAPNKSAAAARAHQKTDPTG